MTLIASKHSSDGRSPSPEFPQSRRGPIRVLSVGVVGAGQMGSEVLLPTLLAMPAVEVCWIVDADDRKAAEVARAYRVPHLPRPSDLGNLSEADAVVLAIPYGVRQPYYDALAGRDCGVYVLKPFARTVDEHRRLCSLFPPYGLGCGLMLRSWGPTALLKALVRKRVFGDLRAVRYSRTGTVIVTAGGYGSNLEVAGGGILFENGVHGIDAILHVTDAVSAEVNSATMIKCDGLDVHTEAVLSVRGNVEKDIEVELTVSCLQDGENAIDYVFEHAVVRTSVMGNPSLTVRTPTGSPLGVFAPGATMLYPQTAYQAFHENISRFLAGLRDKTPNYTSAAESVLTTVVLEELYRRARE